MVTTIAEMQGILTLDDSQYKKGMQGAKNQSQSLGSSIKNTGAQMTKFGLGASLALAPVTLFLKSSVSAFRDFDVAMVNSQTILGVTNEEMKILSDQVLEIGSNTGLGPQAVADSFFTVVSGVQDATTHMDILQSSVRLAEAGMADLAVTTDGMVAVMNSYQFAAEDASFVSDVFTRTVQTGVGTMDDFVGALAPLASLANQLQIDFDDLAASEAFLTTQGQSASAAATELQAIMTAFIKPSQGMTDALNAMGVESGLMLLQTEGLQGAVDVLSASLGDDAIALGEVFTRAEALKGAMILAGDGAEEFGTAFQNGVEGATEAAADLQNATDAAIGDAFMAKLDTLKIVTGEGLSGAIADVQTELMPFIESITTWAQENPETVKQVVMFAGGLVVLAGGLVVVGGLVTILGAGMTALALPAVIATGLIGLMVFAVDQLARAMGFEGITDMFVDTVETWIVNIENFGTILDRTVQTWKANFENLGTIIDKVSQEINPSQAASGLFAEIQALAPGGSSQPVNTRLRQVSVESQNMRMRRQGFAGGGDAEAFQPMTVGELGPERITFPVPGRVTSNDQMGNRNEFNITIIANDEAGGRAAGRGFRPELESILQRNG